MIFFKSDKKNLVQCLYSQPLTVITANGRNGQNVVLHVEVAFDHALEIVLNPRRDMVEKTAVSWDLQTRRKNVILTAVVS